MTDKPATDNGARIAGRLLVAGILLLGAVAHLSFARKAFSALVPDWIPIDKDIVIVTTGYMELALGLVLIVFAKHRRILGWITAVYLLLVFAGNIFQFTEHKNAFGLDTDLRRGIRLLFQPPLILLILWATGILGKKRKAAPVA
jgi:uncharacterized membrane protein